MEASLIQLEQILRDNNAESFITAVDGAVTKAGKIILMSLRAFYQQPELLYAALSHASARGVAVTFTPGAMPGDADSETKAERP
ncbi:hypothetical protein OG738_03805 [Amycolatopsis sp. NBC_01488]|uniref:hypothetical protein n=1 Tax=Amycolatopsis sp. NBC_01488 TaxID=2903563 RepID=UPI002E2E80E6|nr:hypothetical protein [Amycolatopsis sp. NBC_01488]